jgi:CHAT domain-containing protein/Tfp pilus assembly protein PilF
MSFKTRLGFIFAAVVAIGIASSRPSFAQLNEALALDGKVHMLLAAGRAADALPLAQRELAIFEQALGPDDPNVATALSHLALVYDHLGRNDDAISLEERALAIIKQRFGPDHPAVAMELYSLASHYDDKGRSAEAEALYKQALAIRERALGPEHPDVALSLHGLAEDYRAMGRYGEAEPLYLRALAIDQKVLGSSHPNTTSLQDSLAELYRSEGRYAEAEPLYKQALAAREKAVPPDQIGVAKLLNNFAMLYQDQGRYAEAEPLSRRSLAIMEKTAGPNSPFVVLGLINLASLYDKQDRIAETEQLYQRALAIGERTYGPDHTTVATVLSDFALHYLRQGRYADAAPLEIRALAIREAAFGLQHPEVADSQSNLADIYRAQGRYAEAEPYYKRALEIRLATLGDNHPEYARTETSLASLYLAQGRYADALPLVRATIAAAHADVSVALAVLYAAQGKGLISAADAIDQALVVVQRAAQTSAAAAVNKLAVRLAAGNDRLATLVRNDQDLATEADSLDKSLVAAVSKDPSQRDLAGEQRMRDRLTAVVAQRNALQKVFAAEFPDYAALSNPEPLAAATIQKLLSADEGLVAFSSGDRESYVFAITREAIAWKKIAPGSAALADRVAAFRRGLDIAALVKSASSGTPETFDLGQAYEMYATLLGPVDASIAPKKNLLVVPAGALTALPFHLLVTEKPPASFAARKDIALYREAAWLLKRQAVSVLPSIASLRALRVFARADHAAPRPMVGFGDPVFDPVERAKALQAQRAAGTRVATATRAYSEFWQGAGVDRTKLAQALPSLLDTADEVKAVAARLGAPASDIHLGADASETTLKRAILSDYRVLYFATHGLVAGDVKGLAEPSLVLTLPAKPTEFDDGLLTASEVAQLKLNADWVVLSACNTAAGDKPGAEALSGLARAFIYAGARALLVSHWSVASEAATRLATSTFDIIRTNPGIGRAEALRRAMLAYMNDNSNALNAYPGYWGPFSIVGEGDAP